MADECVVCGEAEEGKPLYKKLGSGEFNVEVITALKALKVVSIPEAAKNSSYICWDCDELIVEQYDRYLQEQQEAEVLQKQVKKQQKKKKHPKLKLKISKRAKRETKWGVTKSPPIDNQTNNKKPGSNLSKTKQLEQQRATNAYHSSHCLMCDSNFENESRGYQRFSLKNRVNDEMDIAQVMEVLGLARHIVPKMKARRFVCNPCFFIIRRNYKDKLMKEASGEEAPLLPSTALPGQQNSIHRATMEEHAAEIAKLLPPGLAECYKIVTNDPVNNNKSEQADTLRRAIKGEGNRQRQAQEHHTEDEEEDEEEEEEEEEEEDEDVDDDDEEESGLKVSQDEHGNFFIDVHEGGSLAQGGDRMEGGMKLEVPQTPRNKKNVLLPKRMHQHLSLSPHSTPERNSDYSSGEEDNVNGTTPSAAGPPQETHSSGTCNICGITFNGKPAGWWHLLSSPLVGFDSITVTTALKLLETCLANTSEEAREAQQVCFSCYSKVSTGFKSQVIQRIARKKNLDVAEVNLSRVRVRTLPRTALKPAEILNLGERPSEAGKLGESHPDTFRLDDDSPGILSPRIPKENGDGEKENIVNNENHGLKRKHDEENSVSNRKRRSSRGLHGLSRDARSLLNENETESGQVESLEGKMTGKPWRRKTRIRQRNGRFGKIPGGGDTKPQPQATTSVPEETAHDIQKTQGFPRRQSRESAETKPIVVLKDLKFVLPRAAFSGKTVSSHKIESIMTPSSRSSPSQLAPPHTDSGVGSSVLQYIFSSLSTYQPPSEESQQETPPVHTQEPESSPKVCGRCVVCGCNYMMPHSSWHSVEEHILPPTLLVPVRWVCLSLALQLPQLSPQDVNLGRVCKHCFEQLGKQFEMFVKKKVGESCGLEAEAVDLSEYLFTFNPTTMNLEADPKQQSYIHEFEDVGQLLLRIQPLVEQFSVDDMVGRGQRQPLLDQHFSVWLLLILNELRMQIGAAIGELSQWLVALMPTEMYEQGLRPCPSSLATFLFNITKCSKALTEDILQGPMPSWVFVSDGAAHQSESITSSLSGDEDSLHPAQEEEEEDLHWEDFLHYVNLDALVGGKAKQVPPEHFTQGVVYAVWRASQLLGEGEHQAVDWLRQLSPLPLSKEQLENLVATIGQLHIHLEEHPEDIHELQCEVIPQLQRNKQESVESCSLDSENKVHIVPNAETNSSGYSNKEETPILKKPCHEKRKRNGSKSDKHSKRFSDTQGNDSDQSKLTDTTPPPDSEAVFTPVDSTGSTTCILQPSTTSSSTPLKVLQSPTAAQTKPTLAKYPATQSTSHTDNFIPIAQTQGSVDAASITTTTTATVNNRFVASASQIKHSVTKKQIPSNIKDITTTTATQEEEHLAATSHTLTHIQNTNSGATLATQDTKENTATSTPLTLLTETTTTKTTSPGAGAVAVTGTLNKTQALCPTLTRQVEASQTKVSGAATETDDTETNSQTTHSATHSAQFTRVSGETLSSGNVPLDTLHETECHKNNFGSKDMPSAFIKGQEVSEQNEEQPYCVNNSKLTQNGPLASNKNCHETSVSEEGSVMTIPHQDDAAKQGYSDVHLEKDSKTALMPEKSLLQVKDCGGKTEATVENNVMVKDSEKLGEHNSKKLLDSTANEVELSKTVPVNVQLGKSTDVKEKYIDTSTSTGDHHSENSEDNSDGVSVTRYHGPCNDKPTTECDTPSAQDNSSPHSHSTIPDHFQVHKTKNNCLTGKSIKVDAVTPSPHKRFHSPRTPASNAVKPTLSEELDDKFKCSSKPEKMPEIKGNNKQYTVQMINQKTTNKTKKNCEKQCAQNHSTNKTLETSHKSVNKESKYLVYPKPITKKTHQDKKLVQGKTAAGTLPSEGSEGHTENGNTSRTISKPNKAVRKNPPVIPGEQGQGPRRTSQGSHDKKPKQSFEQLMNYDADALIPP